MNPSDTIVQTIWEDGDATELAHIHINGVDVTQADIASISRSIFDISGSTPDTVLETTAPVVASVIFDTLQTDDRWTKDNTGYNFRERIAGTSFPTGGHTYLVEYLFTGANGEKFWLVYGHPAKSVRTS